MRDINRYIDMLIYEECDRQVDKDDIARRVLTIE